MAIDEQLRNSFEVFKGARTAENFSAVVREYTPRVRGVIYNIVSHLDDTDDLTQETFLKAFKHFDSFQFDAKFSTWLLSIATHLALNYLRKSKRIINVSDDHFEKMEDLSQPSDALLALEDRKKIHKMIYQLPENLRVVLVLSVIEELPTSEIAIICDCSRTMVYWRLHQARKRMNLFMKHSSEKDENNG